MRTSRMAAAAALSAVLVASAAIAEGPSEHARTPDQIKLQPVPNYGGITAAILEGDPDKEGYYVLRVRFPAGVTSPPHAHDQDRYITVIEGVWHFGVGASGDCAKTTPIPAGGFAKHPAGLQHFDGACGDAVTVQISGYGPVATEFHKHSK